MSSRVFPRSVARSGFLVAISLPVNRPHAEVNTYNRDDFMRMDNSGTGAPNYEPNSFDGPKEAPQNAEHAYDLQGRGDRYDHRQGYDDYTQAGDLFRLMPKDAQQRLISNIVGSLKNVTKTEIQLLQISHFYKADPAYGRGVAEGLGIRMDEVEAA